MTRYAVLMTYGLEAQKLRPQGHNFGTLEEAARVAGSERQRQRDFRDINPGTNGAARVDLMALDDDKAKPECDITGRTNMRPLTTAERRRFETLTAK